MSEKYIIPTPGDTIAGKYHIERELGRGAYGVVFRARQEGIDRHVALKTLLPKAFLETEIVDRFEREAKFVGRLNHPNIVGVHDYGRHENLLYMAVEYVEGQTLEQILAEQAPLQPDRARHILYQMIDALEHAHEAGIVHRDLKPANIVMLERVDADTGERVEVVKVLDFGIAKLIQTEADEENHATLTQAGTVLGTPHYMSPESIVGDPIDHRADLYSLGVIAFEMLTGERPFGAKNAAGVMVKHLRDAPPELPAHLEQSCWGEAVRGCLQKRPEDRIQTAVQVRDILERRDEGQPADPATATTGPSAALSDQRRLRKGLGAAVLVGIVVALGIAAAFHLFTEAEPDADLAADVQAEQAQRTVVQGSGDAGDDEETTARTDTSMEFGADEIASLDQEADSRVDGGADDDPRPDDPAASADDHPHAPAERAGVPAEARPSRSKNAKTATAEAPKQVTISIKTTPAGARVVVDGSPAGTTPTQHQVDGGTEPINIELSLIGYRTRYESVVPDEDRQLSVELEKGRLKLIP